MPADAVVALDAVDLRSVVVPAGSRLPAAVGAGTRVDVWFNPRATPGSAVPASPAHVVAEDVLVEDVTVEDSMFAGAESRCRRELRRGPGRAGSTESRTRSAS